MLSEQVLRFSAVRTLMPALTNSPWVGNFPVTFSLYRTLVECGAKGFVKMSVIQVFLHLGRPGEETKISVCIPCEMFFQLFLYNC